MSAVVIGFIGRHDLKIDDKGRLTIPSRFKSVLKEKYAGDGMQVVVFVNYDKNLSVLPLSEYAREAEKLENYNVLDEESRRLQEIFTGLASVEKVDSSGRIRLSPDLRDTAGIGREVTCIGRNRHFDVWDRERWDATQAQSLGDLKRLAEQVRMKNRPDRG